MFIGNPMERFVMLGFSMIYIFRWKNNDVRKKYYKQLCHLIATGKANSVLIEFGDGHKMITSRNAIRKISST